MATTHQMIVAHTITMSAADSGTFLIPEKNGMNKMFATRLMANGKAIIQPTLLRNAITNTNPKLTTITGYRIVQISPMMAGEGVHDGLASELYHVIQSIGCNSSFVWASSLRSAFVPLWRRNSYC